MEASQSARLAWLQALRALAALIVLVFHAKEAFAAYPAVQKILGQGFFGVDIFFCLSGYIMCLSCSQRAPGARNGARFLLTRLTRIYSGYWPALLLTLAAAAIGLRPVTGDWVASVFLTSPYMHEHYLGTAWTLVYELRFYLAIGVAYFFLAITPTVRNITVLASIIALYNLAIYAFAMDQVKTGSWPLRSVLNGFYLEFMFGMVIFMLNQKYPLKLENCLFLIPIAILLLGAGAFHTLFADFAFLRAATYGLASMAILALFVALQNSPRLRPPAWLVGVGDASFSLYLIHPLLLAALYWVMQRYAPQLNHALLILPGLAFIVVLSWLWFKLLEKPVYHGLSSLILKGVPPTKVAGQPNPGP